MPHSEPEASVDPCRHLAARGQVLPIDLVLAGDNALVAGLLERYRSIAWVDLLVVYVALRLAGDGAHGISVHLPK